MYTDKEILDKKIFCVKVSNLHNNSDASDIKELLIEDIEITVENIIIRDEGKRDGIAFIKLDTIEEVNKISNLKG